MGEKHEKKEKRDKKDKKERREKKDKKDDGKRKRVRDELYDTDDSEAEERAKRKAAKKIEKVAKALGYSNDVNPFGDSDLLKPFVWGKKQTQEKEQLKSGAPVRISSAAARDTAMSEIEGVRARRAQREEEAKEAARLRLEEHRLKEIAALGDWQGQEHAFHLKQVAQRSTIRIIEGREECIDQLVKNILLVQAAKVPQSDYHRHMEANQLLDSQNSRLQRTDPTNLLSRASLEELDTILSAIAQFVNLQEKGVPVSADTEDGASYLEYWANLLLVANATKLHLQRKASKGAASDATKSVHASVEEDVTHLLAGKDVDALRKLQESIDTGIADGTRTNKEYWVAMSGEVGLHIARTRLKSLHESLITTFETLRPQSAKSIDHQSNQNTTDSCSGSSSSSGENVANSGDYGQQRGDSLENMQDDDEIRLAMKKYTWQDKYRPRKPRYLNKVKTGWDWNKYNQTHYDHDNPPPRTIQGYQFTVFYPDMLDKSATPSYHLERADSKEFAVLRFHAPGGPYEDVAFKIVNKEWDVNRRAGFRVTFDRGVLNLQFNFKRAFYRR